MIAQCSSSCRCRRALWPPLGLFDAAPACWLVCYYTLGFAKFEHTPWPYRIGSWLRFARRIAVANHNNRYER